MSNALRIAKPEAGTSSALQLRGSVIDGIIKSIPDWQKHLFLKSCLHNPIFEGMYMMNKAAGPDGISAEVFKVSGKEIEVPHFLQICGSSQRC